jgi:hypothetical protein
MLGFSPQYLSEEQISIIESLSDDEIQLLVRIKSKLDSVAGDLEGHNLEAGGVVW